MKKTAVKLAALLITMSMMSSLTACSGDFMDRFDFLKESRSDRDRDDDDDEEEETKKTKETKETKETDETEPSETEPTETEPTDEPTPTPANSGLVFPTEPYSYEKVHPYREPGTITGDAAVEELKSIEQDYLVEAFDGSYLDISIYFDDYEAMGLHIDDISWGEVSFDPEEDRETSKKYIDRLAAIDYESLPDSDRIFYDKILYDIEESYYLSEFTGFYYLSPVFNSLTSQQCNVLFTLDVVTFDTKEDAENYIELIKDTDRYYDDLCAFEEQRYNMGYCLSADSYEAIALTFDSIVAQKDDCFLYESFATRLDDIEGLSDEDKETLIADHEKAMKENFFAEFEECAERMRALGEVAPNETDTLATYQGGKDYYAALVRRKTNSQLTPEEAIEKCDEYLLEAFTGYVAGGFIQHDYTAGDVQENLDFLYGKIFDYFPEIPDHKYTFKMVPEVFQDSFSPAAYLAYHVDKTDSNLILINTAAAHEDFGITVAHEAYPGHMYQSLYTRSICDHPYMYIFESIGYAEGWTEYVETHAPIFFGATEEEQYSYQCEDMLDTLIMSRIDLGVNYEGWTAEDAADYINDLLGMKLLKAESLQDCVDLVTEDPCYAVKYGLGYVNLTETMEKIRALDPDMTPKEYHKLFLDSQTGTYEQIYEVAKRHLEN